MKNNDSLTMNTVFSDILEILPRCFECYCQAPSFNFNLLSRSFKIEESDYYKKFKIQDFQKKDLLKIENEFEFSRYIQNIQIRDKDKFLLEGYDGLNFFFISKELKIPEWFVNKYVPDYCQISEKW